ncbi:MAG TPA: alpha/beta hydrolase [Terracidiphilus sp.]|jgi:esterase/lipase superfamily enzyme|nr:alpha/beta hydrolase [Terracidiphilus sp.]
MLRLALRAFAAFLLLTSSLQAFLAQPSPSRNTSEVTIQGTVQASDATPLLGARVDLRSGTSSDDVVMDTHTDIDGKFAILSIPLAPGQYILHVAAIGFESTEKAVDLRHAASTASLNFVFTLRPAPKERGAASPYTKVRVFYATDRQAVSNQNTTQFLGIAAQNGALAYGACDVSIPESHTLAALERPSIWKLEFHADPEKNIVLQKVTPEPKDLFLKDVAATVSGSPGKEAFVFVHGYNVSFEDAAVRTAQLTYDFGFKGAPIFYSWPSKGSLLGYLADEISVAQTTAHLRQFLQDVANTSGATTVHLIAHSMGNRALLTAVAQLASDNNFTNFNKFSSFVLAAPDVDRDEFTRLVSQIQKPRRKFTLYVSAHDQALEASYLLFHREMRAGEGGSNAIVLPGLDTVDVSQLSSDALGHSYYGDNPSVVQDLLKFLKGQLAPRPSLSRVPLGSLAYWQLLPAK